MTVLLIAAPLMARSGVYRSTVDLVTAAREAGHDWRAVIGVRPTASGSPSSDPRITEHVVHERGRLVLPAIRELIAPELLDASTVITMVPQSDVAVSSLRDRPRHVAWVRGLPWPGAGEQNPMRSLLLRRLETNALRRADAVWATSPLLAGQIGRAASPAIVPAGVPLLRRTHHGEEAGPLIWAGRLSPEKGPREMVDIARRTGAETRMFGEGPLLDALRTVGPEALHWPGWADPETIWTGAGIAMCTSHRDAFGRSPVEAASAGMPLVMSDQTGVAPFLYTDPDLASRFILPVGHADAWVRAVRDLLGDEHLRRRASDHVHDNAQKLSIEASFAAAHSHLK